MDLFGAGLVDGQPEVDVRRFLEKIHPTGVYEIRSLNCPDRRGGTFRTTHSGYFNDHAAAAREVKRLENLHPPGIYCTANPVLPELLARGMNKVASKSKTTATDGDVTLRHNLFLDIDADKRAGISATDAEATVALEKAITLRDRLTSEGWPDPVFGLSGNGAALLYRIDMPADAESLALVGRLYAFLNEQWQSDVDVANVNAARLTKVLGTMARKGDSLVGVEGVEDRPHRRSWYVLPESYDVVTTEKIKAIAGDGSVSVPGVSLPEYRQAAGRLEGDTGQGIGDKSAEAFDSEFWQPDDEFDIEAWINEHGVPVRGPVPWSGGPRKWVFTQLPCLCEGSPSGHTDYPAVILEHPPKPGESKGAVSAKCSHEQCTWKWKHLRKHYEPDACERSRDVIPVRPDLYVGAGLGGGSSRGDNLKPRIGSSNKTIEKATSTRKRLQKLFEALVSIVDEWTVHRVLGDEHHYRLSGDFFESRSSVVDYLELDFDHLWDFNAFNKVLGKWRTGTNCLLPSAFCEVWKEGVSYLLDKAIDIDGHNETRMTAVVAERLSFMIANRAIPFDRYSDPEIHKAMDTESMGVVRREKNGVREYLIDFTKALRTLHDHYDFEIKKQHLTQTLNACGAEWTKINVINKKFRLITAENLAKLHSIAAGGDAEEVVLAPHEKFKKDWKPDYFDQPMDGVDTQESELGDYDDVDTSFDFGANA